MSGSTSYHAGRVAEDRVCDAYLNQGYHLLARRWRGRSGEIDLVLESDGQVVFVEVKLKKTNEEALTEFNTADQGISEIEQCHMIAGAFDYLLKLRTKDMRSYREVLGSLVSTLPHVDSTSTHVSMQSVKDSAL